MQIKRLRDVLGGSSRDPPLDRDRSFHDMVKIDLPGRHRLDAITSEPWTASDWNR
jgi:hypothetical protein